MNKDNVAMALMAGGTLLAFSSSNQGGSRAKSDQLKFQFMSDNGKDDTQRQSTVDNPVDKLIEQFIVEKTLIEMDFMDVTPFEQEFDQVEDNQMKEQLIQRVMFERALESVYNDFDQDPSGFFSDLFDVTGLESNYSMLSPQHQVYLKEEIMDIFNKVLQGSFITS